jgi:hypothetical protein
MGGADVVVVDVVDVVEDVDVLLVDVEEVVVDEVLVDEVVEVVVGGM